MICTVVANLWSKKKIDFERFLPPWYDIPKKHHDPLEGFKRLMELAEANPAND